MPEYITYYVFEFVGGPKDGHRVKVRARADGSFKIQPFKFYKLKHGKSARYSYNHDKGIFEFDCVCES